MSELSQKSMIFFVSAYQVVLQRITLRFGASGEIFPKKSLGKIWWLGKVAVLLHPQIRNEAHKQRKSSLKGLP